MSGVSGLRFTVLGGRGFIGAALVAHLRGQGAECRAPVRAEPLSGPLGHVLYCIGVTADFRSRPLDTVRAHVCRLADVLECGRFDSLLYLSSARVYRGADRGDEEAPIRVRPEEPDDLYDLSKLQGEALCHSTGRAEVRVARLANVFGDDPSSDNFLPAVLREAATGLVVLRTSLDSAKEYVAVDDVVRALPALAVGGRERTYNVTSGEPVSNRTLLEHVALLTGCRVEEAPGAPTVTYPRLSVARLAAELDWRPRSVLDALPALYARIRASTSA